MVMIMPGMNAGAGIAVSSPILDDAEADRRKSLLGAPLILSDEEAERQRVLLLGLLVALDGLGIQAVLARNHHLGLPTPFAPVSGACGQKPPSLHVFAGWLGMVRVQVRDGSFVLATGQSFPAGDAGKAADDIRRLAGLDRARTGSSLPVAADRAEV